MELRVLGPVEVVADGGDPLAVGGVKPRGVLAMLAVEPGRVVSVERLVDGIWGEDAPGKARGILQVYVSNLRKALGSGAIDTLGGGYRLGDVEVDLVRFRCLVDQARVAADAGSRSRLLEEALLLWRGAALGGIGDLPFAGPVVAGLEDERLAAWEARVDTDLELGRHEQLIGELETLVASYPLREKLQRQLMLALYRAGRQADALAVYEDARATLSNELGLDPSPELRGLHEAVLRQDTDLAPPFLNSATSVSDLPVALSGFVGRDRELGEVGALVGEHRLVTVTGVGGIGKTRLALQTVVTLQGKFPDGVWAVELAAVTDPGLVVDVVAAALGVLGRPGRETLDVVIDFLRPRRVLLVVDNCEHLIDAVASLVADLLAAAADLHVVATSREPLAVAGEAVYRLDPMQLPDSEASAGAVAAADAVRLFSERARLVRPHFAVTDSNAGLVTGICRRVDGIPLAIELAAARTRVLDLDEIVVRLADRFRLLTDGARSALPRQRTLEATLDWSHGLLTQRERVLFRRLAVFAGGFTLEAAEAVCADGELDHDRILEVLSHLVDRSLVVADTPLGRYRLLETVRQYATARLREADEFERLRTSHATYYLELAEPWQRLYGPDELSWLRPLRAEQDNLRVALASWIDAGRAEAAVRLAVALWIFWWYQRAHREACDWLSRALELPGEVSDGHRAKALFALGRSHQQIQGRRQQARAELDQALVLYRRLDDPAGEADCLRELGTVDWLFEGDLEGAASLLYRSLRVAESAGARHEAAQSHYYLGIFHHEMGRFQEAWSHLEDARAAFHEAGDRWLAAWVNLWLGNTARSIGDLETAEELGERAVATFREFPDPGALAYGFNCLGMTRRLQGDHAGSVELHREALALERHLRPGEEFLSLLCLGRALRVQGDLRHAAEVLRESLQVASRQDRIAHWHDWIQGGLSFLAGTLRELGDAERAARLLGAARTLDPVGTGMAGDLPNLDAELESELDALRRELDHDTLERLLAEGRAMSIDEAIAYALIAVDGGHEGRRRSVPGRVGVVETSAELPPRVRRRSPGPSGPSVGDLGR